MQNSALHIETVHAEGTIEEKQQIFTEPELPSHDTVINTVTDYKNSTNLESSAQALNTKDDVVIDLTTDVTEERYQQDLELHS